MEFRRKFYNLMFKYFMQSTVLFLTELIIFNIPNQNRIKNYLKTIQKNIPVAILKVPMLTRGEGRLATWLIHLVKTLKQE